MNSKIKIFLVDDHPLILDGLISYFKNSSDFEIVGTASSANEALAILDDVDVDIVVTDIQMPQMNGVEFTEELLKRIPDQKIVVLTMFGEVAFIKRLLQLGVKGYMLKDIGREDLFNALRMIHAGENFYSKEVTEVMMNKIRGVSQKSSLYTSELTDREKEILHKILNQKSNQEIAEELFISARTVEAHKRNMLSKTGSKNLAGLVIFALENHIFSHLN